MSEPATSFDAIIVAGGAGKRLGGSDKALLTVGAQSLLDRAIDAVRGASQIIVVGPRRATDTPVIFTQEQPPGSGPAAAVAHAATLVKADAIVLLAVDVPFAKSAVPRLLAALSGHDAAMAVDGDGNRQPLIAAYRAAALRSRAAEGPWANRAVRAFVEPFTTVDVPAQPDETLDCDTLDDVARAHAAAARAEPQLGSAATAEPQLGNAATAEPQLGNGRSGTESS